MAAGCVYVLINKAMPGMVKIGFTTRDIKERVKELNTTGVPHQFVIAYFVESGDPKSLEQSVHRRLKKKRVAAGKEFFRITAEEAISAIESEKTATDSSNTAKPSAAIKNVTQDQVGTYRLVKGQIIQDCVPYKNKPIKNISRERDSAEVCAGVCTKQNNLSSESVGTPRRAVVLKSDVILIPFVATLIWHVLIALISGMLPGALGALIKVLGLISVPFIFFVVGWKTWEKYRKLQETT